MPKERKRPIRAKTFKAFMYANLRDNMEDIARHGADAGYPWLTYYVDTSRLFEKYHEEIWKLAADEAEQMGSKNVGEFIGGFNRADMLGDWTQFECLMVWFAAETYAREYVMEREDKRND